MIIIDAELVRTAPNLHTLEIRTSSWALTDLAKWVPDAGQLKSLRSLTVTIDGEEHAKGEDNVVSAAREVMRKSPAASVKSLVVRWQLHKYKNTREDYDDGHADEFRVSRETFTMWTDDWCYK